MLKDKILQNLSACVLWFLDKESRTTQKLTKGCKELTLRSEVRIVEMPTEQPIQVSSWSVHTITWREFINSQWEITVSETWNTQNYIPLSHGQIYRGSRTIIIKLLHEYGIRKWRVNGIRLKRGGYIYVIIGMFLLMGPQYLKSIS